MAPGARARRGVGCFGMAELRGDLKVKDQGMEATAFCHGTPELATLQNVIHIVGDHDVRIKQVSALLTIAIGVV